MSDSKRGKKDASRRPPRFDRTVSDGLMSPSGLDPLATLSDSAQIRVPKKPKADFVKTVSDGVYQSPFGLEQGRTQPEGYSYAEQQQLQASRAASLELEFSSLPQASEEGGELLQQGFRSQFAGGGREFLLDEEVGSDWDEDDETELSSLSSTPAVRQASVGFMAPPQGHHPQPIVPQTGEYYLDEDDDPLADDSTELSSPYLQNMRAQIGAALGKVPASPVHEGPVDPFLGKQLGNFRILEKIGEGGFGSVYKAEQVHLNQFFAVKILRTGRANEETIERFRREARALARIRHENVVQLSDFGLLQDDSFYLVMEYLEGGNLSEVIKRGETFSRARTINLMEQICSVLYYVHELGIFHRDLKPANILLVEDKIRNERIKLIDFGIAAAEENEGNLTREGTYLGSPLYMAPEQGRNEELDARSDLYSLGIIFYQLLTGQTPFLGDSLHVLLSKHLFVTPPPLAEIVPGQRWVPELEQFVQRALAKSREDRPPSAAEFWIECQRALLLQQQLENGGAISSAGMFDDLSESIEEQLEMTPHGNSLLASEPLSPDSFETSGKFNNQFEFLAPKKPARSNLAWNIALVVIFVSIIGIALKLFVFT